MPADRAPQLILLAMLLLATPLLAESPPLHEAIDGALAAAHDNWDAIIAEPASDSEFVRRIYLDLTGVIPTAEEARQFQADTRPDKHARLIDQLLETPAHARRMQYVFDRMLMERQPGKHIKVEAWRNYLRTSAENNKPWDELVRELLTADGADERSRPAARFLLDRELKPEEVTRALGRMFLGRDLQCAQCHDHPTVEDYTQAHYHGLAAFLNRTYLFTDPKSKKASIGEKAEGAVKFTSVFTNDSAEAAPQILNLSPVLDPPEMKEPYRVKPAKNVRSIPAYSRRLQLADAMLDSNNIDFRRNIANRLWALMMGRGIVEPVDMMHADNPPSHPELLDLLADSLVDHCYDMRLLIRELALTQAYQRSSRRRTDTAPPAETFAVALLKPLTAEQLAWSMMQATGVAEAEGKAEQEKHLAVFVERFGVIGVQTSQFDPSADQALFLRNSELVQGWIGRLADRLAKLPTPELIDELFLTVLARSPSEEDAKQTAQWLETSKQDRNQSVRQLVWAALLSAEFRLNH